MNLYQSRALLISLVLLQAVSVSLHKDDLAYLCPTKVKLPTEVADYEIIPTYQSIECNPLLHTITINNSSNLQEYKKLQYDPCSKDGQIMAFMHLDTKTRIKFAETYPDDIKYPFSSRGVEPFYEILTKSPIECLGDYLMEALGDENRVQEVAEVIYGLSLQGLHELGNHILQRSGINTIDVFVNTYSKLNDTINNIITWRLDKVLSKPRDELSSNLTEVAFHELPISGCFISCDNKEGKKIFYETVSYYTLLELNVFFKELAHCEGSLHDVFEASGVTKRFITAIEELSENHAQYMAKKLNYGMEPHQSKSVKVNDICHMAICRAEIDLGDINTNFNKLNNVKTNTNPELTTLEGVLKWRNTVQEKGGSQNPKVSFDSTSSEDKTGSPLELILLGIIQNPKTEWKPQLH